MSDSKVSIQVKQVMSQPIKISKYASAEEKRTQKTFVCFNVITDKAEIFDSSIEMIIDDNLSIYDKKVFGIEWAISEEIVSAIQDSARRNRGSIFVNEVSLTM